MPINGRSQVSFLIPIPAELLLPLDHHQRPSKAVTSGFGAATVQTEMTLDNDPVAPQGSHPQARGRLNADGLVLPWSGSPRPWGLLSPKCAQRVLPCTLATPAIDSVPRVPFRLRRRAALFRVSQWNFRARERLTHARPQLQGPRKGTVGPTAGPSLPGLHSSHPGATSALPCFSLRAFNASHSLFTKC